MSTYCISDIHGNLRALQALLVEIDFKYDGSDRLYLLGDYVDWGPDSIETLKFVMRLSEKDYVTCLMGNHDLMFYGEIMCSDCGRNNREYDHNWLYSNRGLGTWDQYLELPIKEREEINDWFSKLEFSAETEVNGKWYLLGHAGPFLPEDDLWDEELLEKHLDAVWHRIRSGYENPIEYLYDDFPNTTWEKRDYERFICGHSITYHYMKVEDNEPYSVFVGEHFTDIDCGAKCMGLNPKLETIPEEMINQCRLAALRLDDGAVFYCDRKRAGYVREEE